MKKLIFLSALITSSFFVKNADAQVGVHFNINLGARRVYAPVPPPVVDNYYYLPEAEAYYSVPEHVYYYQNEGRWITSPHLAGRFYDYDYSRLRHYAINEPRPYLRNDYYRSRYSGPQFAVRDSRSFYSNRYTGSTRGRDNFGRDFYGRNDFHADYHHQNYDNRNWHHGGGRY